MTATVGLVVAGYWCACWPAGKLRLGFSLLTGSMNAVRSCQHYGNGDGFRLLGGAIGALFSPVGLYRGCACRSCRSYLEILGSHQGIFAGVFSGIMERH